MPHVTVQRRSTLRAIALSAVLSLLGVGLVPATAAHAANGSTLRQFTAAVPACSVGTGIAFDGTMLYISCWSNPNVYAVSPVDGHLISTLTALGVNGLGALAYDRTRNALWACTTNTQDVVLIPLGGGLTPTATRRLTPTGGCIDGLAFDGTDDSLYTSGDVAQTVYHWRLDGSVIDTRFVGNSLGGCGNSGLAVGGASLFLANDGCAQIWQAAKSTDSQPQLFASYGARLEDMECDDVTFASGGKAAIWSKDAYDSVLNAFELNIGDCGFGGLPPASGNDFVYVAVGDSYQSGEGAGNSLTDTTQYLTAAYENGSNYPEQVGPQVDTYTQSVSASGDACHRSLVNYAKLNRDRLSPGSNVVLIDVTCSGAQIEPAGKPPVVGTTGNSTYDANSQVAQVMSRLAAAGLSANDVDLVTVGMGGNDAKFGEIVAGCLLPTVARELVADYPNAPGEIKWLVDQFASCKNVDQQLFHTDDAINALAPKELWGQGQILAAFGKARVMQLTYPNILPAPDVAPDWCGGIRKDDLDYARAKIDHINRVLSETVAQTAVADPRIELVDDGGVLGNNALCPATASLTLANGLNHDNFLTEVNRLLNLDGTGDVQARAQLDDLVAKYQAWKSCAAKHYNPFGGDCDVSAAFDTMKASSTALLQYLQQQQSVITANIYAPPGASAETQGVRMDRSRGLFHPNANAYAVIACKVRAQYTQTGAGGCVSANSPLSDTVNGNATSLWPVGIGSFIGDLLHIVLGGFGSNQVIHIVAYSSRRDVGTVMSDANGRVVVDLPALALSPGVHTLQFVGNNPAGAGVVKSVTLDYPGRPVVGDTYAKYFCCFAQGNAEAGPDDVQISYLGEPFLTTHVDHQGGVLVEVPVFDTPSSSADITVRNVRTGETKSATFNPLPAPAAIWSTARTGSGITVTAADVHVTGLAHSDSAVAVSASRVSMRGGVEYVTSLTVSGSGNNLGTTQRVALAQTRAVPTINDFRPGGSAAVAAGPAYHAMPVRLCVNGVWNVAAVDVPQGVVYVPCAVTITGSGTVRATLAAEGPVTVAASDVTVTPTVNAVGILSGSTGSRAVAVSGARDIVMGPIYAVGGVIATAADVAARCGITGSTVTISGARTTVDVGATCRAG